ncbi:glycosyltransferase family 2 protein [Dehalococcoidia bacterium]|nr:glycosyltransferase family 2 protein [Dehalococcoidia bacterium]
MDRPQNYPSVTVLICTLNEEENLPYVLPKIPRWVDEILLVDGHSTDRTVEVAKKLRPEIKVVCQPGRGKGDALRYGIQHASGDIIVTLDADGSTDPEEMPRFIEPLLKGYDFAKGSRFLQGFPQNKPWHRILGNWIIIITFDILFFRRYTDLCSGYNAFWKTVIEQVNPWSPDGFENEPLINCRVRRAGLKVIEVGHSDRGRLGGDIKERSWRQGFKAIKTIIRERFRG